MHRRLFTLSAALAPLIVVALPLVAQDVPRPDSAARAASSFLGTSALGLWAGGATDVDVKTKAQTTERRQFADMALRAAWTLDGDDRLQVRYLFELVPIALATGTPDYGEHSGCRPTHYCTAPVLDRHTTYGAGIRPLGIEVRVLGGPSLELTLHAVGGGLWFQRALPDDDGTSFDYSVEAGATVHFAITSRHRALLGYAFHHLSNGGRGSENPGMNANMLRLGLETVMRER
jgi:hypothetical protein